jgi:hypothetical protein
MIKEGNYSETKSCSAVSPEFECLFPQLVLELSILSFNIGIRVYFVRPFSVILWASSGFQVAKRWLSRPSRMCQHLESLVTSSSVRLYPRCNVVEICMISLPVCRTILEDNPGLYGERWGTG